MTIDEMILDVLDKEKGYVNHPNDRGGPTNLGVTQATLSSWLGRPATIQEIKDLKKEVAAKIFKKIFYYDPKIDTLPDLLEPIIFDISVNSGSGNAIRLLQRALLKEGYDVGSVDGILGKNTINYSNKLVEKLGKYAINLVVDQRKYFYERIIKNDPDQKVFKKGWMNRAESFRVK